MKVMNIMATVILSLFLMGGYAHASDMDMSEGKGHHKGNMDMVGKKSHGGGMEMMQARHQMMNDMMGMLKETMSILKGLNHKPSAGEKEKLGDMIASMDKMIAHHDEMHEKMRERMKEHMEMSKEKMGSHQ